MVILRPHVHVGAFGHVSAAHVLIDDDVSFFGEQRRRTDGLFVRIGSVRRAAIRGAAEKYRIFLRRVLRRVHGRKELHAIAHRDHVFGLEVVGFDVDWLLRLKRALNGHQRKPGQADHESQ